ncbi:hypothetical protein Goklo_001163 [Gossypium klotzschianum]|uniref:Uncharacterized protein n=1 Tax=Gossypium klotzschianum TaxID=34286 RepID=A0A7J8VZQ1_9ROSI|nr:hypothetical protein [Gossypium klotzschianum]
MPTLRRFFAPQDNVALENKVAEREARLIAEAEERFMKLTEIREAKFMDMMDAH